MRKFAARSPWPRHLAPEGKRAALYLWSGGAEPFEAAIAGRAGLGVAT